MDSSTDTIDREDPGRTREAALATALVVAAAAGFSFGVGDLTLAFLDGPTGRSDVSAYFPALAASAAAVAAATALSCVVGIAISRAAGLSSWPFLRFALAVPVIAIGFPLICAALGVPLGTYRWPRLLALAVTGAALAARVAQRTGGGHLRATAAAIAIVVVVASMALWAARYMLEGSYAPFLGFLVAGIGAGAALLRLRDTIVPSALTAVLFALALLSPLASVHSASRELRPLEPSAARSVRHVILVVVDTLRADHLSCASESAPHTPNVDRLAGESVRFDLARSSAPWTLPSMASIMTGTAPSVHGVVRVGRTIPDGLPTLGEAMRDAGYRTAAIGHNTVLHPPAGFERGFDHFEFFPSERWSSPLGVPLLQRFGGYARIEGTAGVITDRALEFLADRGDEDFFLWLHYFDPHYPYDPPQEFAPEGDPRRITPSYFEPREVRNGHGDADLAKRDRVHEFYDAEIRYFDHEFGRVLAALEASGIYEDALIVFTSDHGEEFWEHDGVEHGHSVFDEQLLVPLYFKLPGRREELRVATPVSTVRVAPTVLELCGLREGVRGFPATPLFSVAGEEVASDHAEAVVSGALLFYEDRSSVVFDRYKYVQLSESRREELFDLESDPLESHSLTPHHPEALRIGREFLDAHRARSETRREVFGIADGQEALVDPARIEELRKMGYID